MKRYQLALLFFALGRFAVTSVAVFMNRESSDADLVKPFLENDFKTVSVFFPNYNKNENDCSLTIPVERVLGRLSDNQKSALGEFAYLVLADLLKGPIEQEKAQGFYTSINEGTRVQRVIISNGVATVDFNDRLNEGIAGSCKVQAIRSQIIATLKQFPEIKEVVISVNGESKNILQP